MFDNQCQKQLLGPKLHWDLGPGFWGFWGKAALPWLQCCSARANVDESEMSNQNSGVVSKETGVSLG